jgi:hypothetical protein
MTQSIMRKILVLPAHPDSQNSLPSTLNKVQNGIIRSRNCSQFEINNSLNTTDIESVRREILDKKSQFVHMSGQGSSTTDIWLDEQGQVKFIEADVLSRAFEVFDNQVQCVFLDSCYNEAQAIAIARHIPYVIGVNLVDDPEESYSMFVSEFYNLLGAGKSVEVAYYEAIDIVEKSNPDVVYVKSIHAGKEKIDKKFLVGTVISTIFGVVTADSLQEIGSIIPLLNLEKGDLSPDNYNLNLLLYLVLAVLFFFNTVKMLHGTMVSINDDRNPDSSDIYPDNIGEMIYLMFILLSPSISMFFMKRYHENPYVFLTEYLFPSFVYFFWDGILLVKLSLMLEGTDIEQKRKSNIFIKFARAWVTFDIVGIVISIIMLLLSLLPQDSTYNHAIIRIAAVVVMVYQILLIYCEYFAQNSEFYFPKNKVRPSSINLPSWGERVKLIFKEIWFS